MIIINRFCFDISEQERLQFRTETDIKPRIGTDKTEHPAWFEQTQREIIKINVQIALQILLELVSPLRSDTSNQRCFIFLSQLFRYFSYFPTTYLLITNLYLDSGSYLGLGM